MDDITHLTRKILAERARQHPNNTTAPPPYSTLEDAEDSKDSASEDSSMTLTLNVATSVHGSNNLVPTSSSPLADATKFSTLLLHAINRINAASAAAQGGEKQVKVDLTINCGLTIVGDRNVVGNVGIKPKVAQSAAAVVGTKRKAEEEEEVGEDPAGKVVKVEE